MSQILHTLWASFQFIPVRLSGSPQPASLPAPGPRPPNYPRAGERKRGKSSQVYFSFTPIFFTFGSPAQARGTWLEVRFALEVSLSQLELRRGKYTATDKQHTSSSVKSPPRASRPGKRKSPSPRTGNPAFAGEGAEARQPMQKKVVLPQGPLRTQPLVWGRKQAGGGSSCRKWSSGSCFRLAA